MTNFDFTEFPILTTPRLALVEIQQQHLADIFNIFSDTRVTQYYNIVTLQVLEDAQPFIDWFTLKFADKKGLRWGITLKGEDQIVGTIGINNFTWGQKGLIGYDLRYDSWNKGYMTEAITAVTQFGFEAFGLNRIEAEVMPGNAGSEKTLLKSGFTFEGTLRQTLFFEGTWYDMNMFSLLKGDKIPVSAVI